MQPRAGLVPSANWLTPIAYDSTPLLYFSLCALTSSIVFSHSARLQVYSKELKESWLDFQLVDYLAASSSS